MSRLVDLYSDDGRVVVGRSNTPYPVSVGVGFGIVGQVVTGFTPITTQVQTGWMRLGTNQTRPNTPYYNTVLARPNYYRAGWRPSYTTVTTGYAPVYSPVFGAVYSPMMFGGIY